MAESENSEEEIQILELPLVLVVDLVSENEIELP
jgi:hypothetical protein